MLSFFDKEKLEKYVQLQKRISSNALKNLSINGYFLYITCSVFADENEEVIDFILQEKKLEVVKSSYILGFENKADSMFAALLKHK